MTYPSYQDLHTGVAIANHDFTGDDADYDLSTRHSTDGKLIAI
jgi:hypothetical protein